MSEIKAFVGHSFTKDDELVVRAFTEYLDQIKEMDIGFGWEHAKPAEPKVLSEKIMSLIQDKNLFIGICTKKERVIENEKLKSKLFSSDQRCSKDNNFSWKTSDWIIQEIGLAFGRGMNVILLVEEGLREPGGFQGNLEYIQFSRVAPEKSFGKILEMITAIRPNVKKLNETTAKTPITSEEEEPKEIEREWLNPKPEWDRGNYEIALTHMIAIGDKKGEEKIYEAYLQSSQAQADHEVDSWNAAKEYIHIRFSDDGSLEKLERCAKDKAENSVIQKYLAKAYLEYDEELKAGSAYLVAAENEKDQLQKLRYLGEAARVYAKAKENSKVNEIFNDVKKQVTIVDGAETVSLEMLKDVADINGDKTLYLAYLERLLNIRPDDGRSRFNLAYGHSEENREDLALYHYLKIPLQNRDSSDWNNIGVANTRLKLYGKAIEAYRRAEGMGSTLAMNNIAQKFLGVGFIEEAERICDSAKKTEDYHKNIDETLYELKNKRVEETDKQREILDKVLPIHEFYVKLGKAAAREDAPNMAGQWATNLSKLNLELKNNKFKAYGEYEVSTRGLANALLGRNALIGTGETETKKYMVLYEGELTGYAIRGKLTKREIGNNKQQNTLLAQVEDSKNIFMVIEDDLSSISVYQESATYETQKFHQITKD